MSIRRAPAPAATGTRLPGPAIPKFGKLTLQPPDAFSTGGFYALNPAEVQQLNNDNVEEPIFLERPIEATTFRVEMRVPLPNNQPRYKYYVPSSLWEWAKENSSLPGVPGTTIWFEDWMALHYTFDPDGDIPHWVNATLQKRSVFVAQRLAELLQREQREQAQRDEAAADAFIAEAAREVASFTAQAQREREQRRWLNEISDEISDGRREIVIRRRGTPPSPSANPFSQNSWVFGDGDGDESPHYMDLTPEGEERAARRVRDAARMRDAYRVWDDDEPQVFHSLPAGPDDGPPVFHSLPAGPDDGPTVYTSL